MGLDDGDAVPAVNRWDPVAVKRTIDDCLCKLVVLEGYPEDFWLSNVKLVVMFLACLVATFAQFGTEYPKDRALLAACVAFYAGACALLQLMAWFVERDYVVRTFAKQDMPNSALRIATTLKRGDHVLHVRVEFRDSTFEHVQNFSASVGQYFSEEGELDEKALQYDLYKALRKMEDFYQSKVEKKKQ